MLVLIFHPMLGSIFCCLPLGIPSWSTDFWGFPCLFMQTLLYLGSVLRIQTQVTTLAWQPFTHWIISQTFCFVIFVCQLHAREVGSYNINHSSLGSYDLSEDNLPTQLLFWTPVGNLTKPQMKGVKKPLHLEAVFKKTPGSVIYSLPWQPLAAELPIRDVCLFSKSYPNGGNFSFNPCTFSSLFILHSSGSKASRWPLKSQIPATTRDSSTNELKRVK